MRFLCLLGSHSLRQRWVELRYWGGETACAVRVLYHLYRRGKRCAAQPVSCVAKGLYIRWGVYTSANSTDIRDNY